MYFQNRENGYIEKVSSPGFWTLLFGPFYFLTKGVWTHAIAALLLFPMTIGISWLIYPLYASKAVELHFLRGGWIPLSKEQVRDQVARRQQERDALR